MPQGWGELRCACGSQAVRTWQLHAGRVDRLLVGVSLGSEGCGAIRSLQQSELFSSGGAAASLLAHLRPARQSFTIEVAHDPVARIAVSGEDQVIDGPIQVVLDL